MHRAFRRASTGLVLLAGIAGCGRDVEDAVRQEIRTRLASARAARLRGWRLMAAGAAGLPGSGGAPALEQGRTPAHQGARAGGLHLRRRRGRTAAGRLPPGGAARRGACAEGAGAPRPATSRRSHQAHCDDARLRGGPARGTPRSPHGGRRVVPARAALERGQHAAGRVQGEGLPRPAETLRPHRKSTGRWSRHWRTTGSCAEGRMAAGAGRQGRSRAAPGASGSPRCGSGSGPPASSTRPRTRSRSSTTRWPEAVARFQVRHGLVPDSSVGAATLSALNVPVEPGSARSSSTWTGTAGSRRVREALPAGEHPDFGSGPTMADGRCSSSG